MSESPFHNIPPCVETYALVLDHIFNRSGVGSRRKSVMIPKRLLVGERHIHIICRTASSVASNRRMRGTMSAL